MTGDDLTASAIMFFLRSLGLNDTAIHRHYDPGKLNMIIARIVAE